MMKAISRLPLRMSFFILFSLFYFSSFAFEISCPADMTINCDDDIYDLSQYGIAQYKDYNGWHDIEEFDVVYDIDNCGLGTIQKTFYATNPYGNLTINCTQVLTVVGSSFNESNISWPLTDLDISGCNPDLSPNALPAGYQTPSWTAGTCAIIGSSYTDKVFNFSGACKKIIRTWEVINCCTFNPYTGHGSWKFNQVINVTISDVPAVTCPSDITVGSSDCTGAYVEVPGIIVPMSDCSDQVTIMNDSPYSVSGSDASGTYPIGTTIVTFTADFGCWQKTMCQVVVTVVDETAPTPYCIYGLAVALMGIDADDDGINEDGMIQVWASDLDKGSFPSCNSDSELTFSFSSDVTDTDRTFTCEDVGRNEVEIWVTDDQGRQNYCNTYIRVQNNNANIPDCEDSDEFSTISGHVTAHYGDPLGYMQIKAVATGHIGEQIEVETFTLEEIIYDSIVNASGTTIYFFKTDTVWSMEIQTEFPTETHYTYQFSDMYTFEDLDHYNDYQIFGITEDAEHQLIDLADIADIQDYINGDLEFSAYQKMAADANQDGGINQDDIDLLTDIVYGNAPSDFDTEWHFFDANMNMENMDPDHECEEFCRIQDLADDTYKVNLVGFRLGDVTNIRMAPEETNDEEINLIHTREAIQLSAIQVSPNPFQEVVVLELQSNQQSSATIYIKNELGQNVYTQVVSIEQGANNISLDLRNISGTGVFFYELNIGQTTQTGKLIKIQ